jgi:TetR/AcrR family transcriptional regulator
MPRVGDTRTKILEMAEADFATEGYAGAHLQKIAEQVGVRKTALYYYYESKAALYAAVIEVILEGFERAVLTVLDANQDDPERQLELLATRLNDLLAEHPNYARILFRLFVDPRPPEVQRVYPRVRRFVERILAFYRHGIELGTFRKHSTRHFFQSAFGMLLFHYAAPAFSASVLGVSDVFTSEIVNWRRDEVLALMRDGIVVPKPTPSSD